MTLPVLQFPFETPPDVYAPERTVLQIGDVGRVCTFQWCYLERKGEGRGIVKSVNLASLSEARVRALPRALERISNSVRFSNARPATVTELLRMLGFLLNWADRPEHGGRFEALLADPDLALEALKGYHTYVRSLLQGHQLAPHSAGVRDQSAIACLSEIHGRVYRDSIEPLQALAGSGTKVPPTHLVQEFGSTLQAIFDSAACMALDKLPMPADRMIRVSVSDDSRLVKLRTSFGPLRLMELACMTFSGLVLLDSGANLAVLRGYEEPDDLSEQLSEPDRINLKQKAVKFRAGGKKVEVHLSTITIARLPTYLRLRQALVSALGGEDIAPLFIQCAYRNSWGEPTGIRPLDGLFLQLLRQKVTSTGANLPDVTLRQLRAYKQQELVRMAPLAVAAKVMGHSVQTAITAYCKAQEALQRDEMGMFLRSLHKTVLASADVAPILAHQKVIPIGTCINHGKPSANATPAPVAPECSQIEGCFFCDNYRLHAVADDMRKLMSCRRVLGQVLPLSADLLRAERIYTAVVDRIDMLLEELKRLQPQAYETARVDVEEHGELTRYWASKLQQMYLLGVLPAPSGNRAYGA